MRFGNFVVVKHNGKIVCGKVGDQGIYLKQMGDANPIPFREVEPLFEIELHRPFPEHFKVDDFRKFVISTLADADPVKGPHPAITHCGNCGCDWLDNGLNPVGCPYCKLSAGAEALRGAMEDVDFFTLGARLALELECLLMDTRDAAAQSRWWASAHEALDQWRQAVRAMEAADAEQRPAATSETVNVIGMPEFDGLLDHIYEHGTAAEGVIEKANAFARAVIARYAPQQPAAAGEIDRARFEGAPCYICGYNGPGYYQPDTHPCAAKYHAAQQGDEQ